MLGYSIIDIKLAYIAGIVDGEGCIDTFKSGDKVSYQPRITVVNTNKKVLQLIVDMFEGTICARRKIVGRKQVYSWMRGGVPAGEVIEKLLPYLLIKKEHALLATKLVTCPTSEGVKISAAIAELNHRGRQEK